jgi:hypothetical protein
MPAKVLAISKLGPGQVDHLSHWLEHYTGLGVDQILLAVPRETSPEIEQAIRECAKHWSFDRFSINLAEAEQLDQGPIHKAVLRHAAREEDWILNAQLDELHEFPAPLDQIIAAAKAANIDTVYGEVIEHTTTDGSLPPILPQPPIWEQFPMADQLTAYFLGGRTRELMLARFSPGAGGMNFGSEPAVPLGRPQQYVVHRFNWHNAAVAELQSKMTRPEVGARWKAKADLLFGWIDANCGRLNLKDPSIRMREARHPSRLDWAGVAKPRLPYIGDKVVWLNCDPAVKQSLAAMGVHFGRRTEHSGKLHAWLEALRNEAAMTGAIAAIWSAAVPAKSVAALQNLAADDLVEVNAGNLAEAVAEISACAAARPPNDEKVFAVCPIPKGHAALLAHWMDYYTQLGVDQIIPAGYSEQEEHRSILRQAGATPRTWILHASEDDLLEFPAPLLDIVRAADAKGLKAVFGTLVDRAAPDGVLRTILRAPSLSEQFPMGCQLTESIARGQIQRPMLMRFDVRAEMARHVATNAGVGAAPLGLPSQYLIHRIWHAGTAARLQTALTGPDARAREEAKRLLQWLKINGGRINLNMPTLNAKPRTARRIAS